MAVAMPLRRAVFVMTRVSRDCGIVDMVWKPPGGVFSTSLIPRKCSDLRPTGGAGRDGNGREDPHGVGTGRPRPSSL
jgi:hypothetical protein